MQTIHLDISNKGNVPTIYAKQGDVGRKFSVVITDAGIPRRIEDGEAFSVWYEGTSGVGNYTDIGDESAFSIEGNTVTIEMIAQMLNNAGDGNLCLIMTNTDGDQVGTWNIPYIAEEVPGLGSKPAEQHLNALVDAQKRAESSAIDASVYAQEASMYRDEAKNWAEAAEDAAKRAESAGVPSNAVLYTKQTLTAAQKAQARENIGAADESEVYKLQSKLDYDVECKSLGDTIIRSNNPNNFLNSVTTGIGIAVHTDEPIVRVVINTKASAFDNLVCVLESYDGVTEYARDVQPIGTDYTDITFNFVNTFAGVVRVMFYTENQSRIAIAQYGSTPYTSELMYAENGEYCQWLRMAGNDFYTEKLTGEELLRGINFEVFVGSIEFKSVADTVKEYVHSMNYIYVSKAGSDITGDGTRPNPYATIYHANETIVDNSKDNPYTIIVGQGTYTDLQERYSGTYSGHFEGVNCKDYVYYETENILRPDLCVIEWDGAVGFTTPVTGEQVVDKCPFHICKDTHTHIKGFTLKCKNTRYCMHIETVGSTVPCEWLMENVIFEWGGRPEQAGTGIHPCVGTGYSCMEHGVFRNCVFRLTNTNSGNHMIFQSHDNPDNIGNPITVGERLLFQDCFVSVSDGSEYAHFNLRRSKVNPLVKSTATFDNVVGMPIFITEDTEGDYGINILGATELKE